MLNCSTRGSAVLSAVLAPDRSPRGATTQPAAGPRHPGCPDPHAELGGTAAPPFGTVKTNELRAPNQPGITHAQRPRSSSQHARAWRGTPTATTRLPWRARVLAPSCRRSGEGQAAQAHSARRREGPAPAHAQWRPGGGFRPAGEPPLPFCSRAAIMVGAGEWPGLPRPGAPGPFPRPARPFPRLCGRARSGRGGGGEPGGVGGGHGRLARAGLGAGPAWGRAGPLSGDTRGVGGTAPGALRPAGLSVAPRRLFLRQPAASTRGREHVAAGVTVGPSFRRGDLVQAGRLGTCSRGCESLESSSGFRCVFA